MAKHVHVWLGGRLPGKATKDNEFKESDHPRGKGGKFATSGEGGGDAKHHLAKHAAAWKKSDKLPFGHESAADLLSAGLAHHKAATHLQLAEIAHNKGDAERHAKHMKTAQEGATEAAQFEEAVTKGESKGKGKEAHAAKMKASQEKKLAAHKAALPELQKAMGGDLKNHSQYSKDDYEYLKNKGYTDQEIRKKWDEERFSGHGPQKHSKMSMRHSKND